MGGGIIGFVTNGGWLTSVSGSGFRKSIAKEYNTIYVINLRGNALTSGELRRKEGDGVFDSGSRVSVAIVFLIKTPTLTNQPATIYYYAVADYLKRQAKFDLLNTFQTVTNPVIPWTIIAPDDQGDWVDQTMLWPTNSLPFRSDLKLENNVFNTYMRSFNSSHINFDKSTTYDKSQLFKCQSHPFVLTQVYFKSSIKKNPNKQQLLFLTKPLQNRAIIVQAPGLKVPWSVFITNQLFGLRSVCFPEYTYQTDQAGTITTLNTINDQVLNKAQSLYNDATITTNHIFDYLYGLLHHPTYQLQYQTNLQKGYPNLIWVTTKTTWWIISNLGRQLAELHLNFETIAPTSTIVTVNIKDNIINPSYEVVKMKWSSSKPNTLIFNNDITITNIPANIDDYQVFAKSPLKWIIDKYQVTIDQATGIKNDPNQLDNVKQHPRYLLDLVLRIINLTTQTLLLIDELTKQELV